MSAVNGPCWYLECYARYQNSSNSNTESLNENNLELNGTWKYIFSTPTQPIRLSLENSSYLTIIQNNTILENHAVVCGTSNISVYFCGDFMLFINQLAENSIRRFRVKFSTNNEKNGEESCVHSVSVLEKLFTVKQLTSNHADYIAKGFNVNTISPSSTYTGVSVKKIAKILLNQDETKLSSAYQASKSNGENIDKILHLCLSDPMFPVFVNQVQQHINNLKMN